MQYIFPVLIFIVSLFLILLVLVQRGRGGGLSGAFGGMGGQSAFGAKAGDTFTKVTVATAAIWILLCMLATGMLSKPKTKPDVFSDSQTAPVDTDNFDLQLDDDGPNLDDPANSDNAGSDPVSSESDDTGAAPSPDTTSDTTASESDTTPPEPATTDSNTTDQDDP